MRGEMKSVAAALTLFLGALLPGFSAIAQEGAPVKVPAPVPAKPPSAAPAPAAGDPVGVGTGWTAEVAPSGRVGLTLDASQSAIVEKVSGYFNALSDLKGSFVQTAADKKRMKGKFFVKRPGRFRFDYARPSRQIIISDGEYLAIQDLDLNHEDRIALDQTPFRLLLRKDVNLLRDAKIVEVQESDDLIVVALVDKNPEASGRIKLFFSTKPHLELKEWTTIDAQGLATRVEISRLVKGEEIDVSMFKIKAVTFNQLDP
jgi:outer membrane lipoprotein-sorting protein